MSYVGWAVLGMVAYSSVTLLVKLATRGGELSAFAVLTIAISIVGITIALLALTVWRSDVSAAVARGFTRNVAFAGATGVALSVAVSSLFIALSRGPATTVVPIYGMFLAGGAVLGIVVLGEPATPRKLLGLALAVASIILIAGGTPRR